MSVSVKYKINHRSVWHRRKMVIGRASLSVQDEASVILEATSPIRGFADAIFLAIYWNLK